MTLPHKQFLTVNSTRIAYTESGDGDPIVFLHGNPTSSYLWRDVIPYLAGTGRCLAPDLIGMGDSDKLPTSGPDSYTFLEHREHLDRWMNAIAATDRVTLVGHDWAPRWGSTGPAVTRTRSERSPTWKPPSPPDAGPTSHRKRPNCSAPCAPPPASR